jgi:hypothetical protein
MTRAYSSYAVSGLRIEDGVRPAVYVGGQDVRLSWRTARPYGGGYGDAPYDLAPYGGVEDGELRGALVQVWFGRLGNGEAPFVLARETRVMETRYVYREIDNRADASRYGLPFQSVIRFVVRPLTSRGYGVSAELTTNTTNAPDPDAPSVSSLALDDLTDVNAAAPADGDALVWDAGTSRWVPAAVGGGPGAASLDDLTDVVVTSPAAGNALVFDGASWVDGPISLSDADAVTGALPVANGGTGATNQADARTNLGLGTLATQSGTFSGTSIGTNTGDQTITLTGDVTGSGTGSFVATIADAIKARITSLYWLASR